MKNIRKIIVPIDFLQHTEQLVEYALYFAKKFGAELKFAHVVEPPQSYGGYEYPSLGALTEEVVKHTEKQMEELVKKNRHNCSGCAGKIFRGNIVDCLVEYAAEEEADLIIIGTHGRKGLEKMWLGSIAERVVKRAPCPTLTCNPYKKSHK